jgi:hypothetical protein
MVRVRLERPASSIPCETERPFAFFVSIGCILALTSIVLAIPLLLEFLETGLVPRIPTAVLSTGLMLVSVMSFVCGLILDTVTRGRRELKRMHYLLHTALTDKDEPN